MNLVESAICLLLTASAMLMLEPTMESAASFFCAPDFAP